MKPALAFLFGLLFGAGLLLSGMTSPLKVLGFLDVAGAWDPALGFVMGGAVLAAAPLFALARRRDGAPPSRPIDRRLVVGAAIFGIGWGIAGICPGPAIVDLPLALEAALPFCLALLVGLWLARLAAGTIPAAEKRDG